MQVCVCVCVYVCECVFVQVCVGVCVAVSVSVYSCFFSAGNYMVQSRASMAICLSTINY